MNIFFLYLISFLTRFLFLFFGMPSVTHDEADFFTNSYILAKTGTDIWNKKIFFSTGIININSSLIIYLNALFFSFFKKNIYDIRLIYVILSSFIPVLFYLIISKITKNKIKALFIFLIFNFAPFFVHMSIQGGIEIISSLLLFLITFYLFILINYINKK